MGILRKLDNEDMSSLRSWLNVMTKSRVAQGEVGDFFGTCK
jgi:hypothetical protein